MAKTIFSAMLAHHLEGDMAELRNSPHYPMYSSFKLDGIRGINRSAVLVSRSDKPLPSSFVQATYGTHGTHGFDGEMVVRDIRPGNVYKDTFSAVMTHGAITPVDWHVFDDCSNPQEPFEVRYDRLRNMHSSLRLVRPEIKLVEQRLVRNWEELLAHEKEALDLGYEGLVVRRRNAPYKYGRSTGPQQYLMAMVRHATSECVILGCYEGLQNTNEPVINSLGYTTRSKHIAQMVGKDTLGGFFVRDYHTHCEFKIGTGEGLDHAARDHVWRNPSLYLGKICKYKYKPYGMDIAPRQPVILWGQWRDPSDM